MSEELKNLGFRLGKTGPLDKKVERSIKTDLLAKFKTAADEAIKAQSTYESLLNTVYYLSVLQGCFTGLSAENEDWALKIQANLLDADTRKQVVDLMGERNGKTKSVEEFLI